MIIAYLLSTGLSDSHTNMAVDEAMFLAKKCAIRFYGWSQPAITIGYFQKSKDVPKRLPFVRRITGGGTVEHGEDITFSIVLDLSLLPFLESVKNSYYWIHKAIQDGLTGVGVKTMLYEESKMDGVFCFKAPTVYDLMLGNEKVVGGAQRRRGKYLLHQGTIQNISISQQELQNAVMKGLSNTFQLDFSERSDILTAQKDQIETLKKKYSSREWNFKF